MKDPVVYHCTPQSWYGRQHFYQGLASTMARDRLVVYVSAPVLRGTKPRPSAQRIDGADISRPEPNIVVVEPVVPRGARLLRFPLWRWFFTRLIRRATMSALGRLGLSSADAVLWTYTPDGSAFLAAHEWQRSVYWTGDEVTLPGEDRLLQRVDHVLAVSPPALERVRAVVGDRAQLVPMAIDPTPFMAARRRRSVPAELATCRRPIAGYGGALSWRMDWDLLVAFTSQFPGTVVLVGPVLDEVGAAGVERLRQLDNAVALGHRDAQSAPDYLAAFDVGLIPYAAVPFNYGSNPLKCYEYLAAGIPVVATPIPALEPLAPIVSFADDASTMCRLALDACGGINDAAAVAHRQSVAQAHSLDRLVELVDGVLAS